MRQYKILNRKLNWSKETWILFWRNHKLAAWIWTHDIDLASETSSKGKEVRVCGEPATKLKYVWLRNTLDCGRTVAIGLWQTELQEPQSVWLCSLWEYRCCSSCFEIKRVWTAGKKTLESCSTSKKKNLNNTQIPVWRMSVNLSRDLIFLPKMKKDILELIYWVKMLFSLGRKR